MLEYVVDIITILAAAISAASLFCALWSVHAATKPILMAHLFIAKSDDRSDYIIRVKNYGHSSAIIQSFTCDRDLSTITNEDQLSIIQSLPGLEIPPSSEIVLQLSPFKIEATFPFEKSPFIITTTLRYKGTSWVFRSCTSTTSHDFSLAQQFKNTYGSLLGN